LNELGVETKGMDLVSMHGKLNEILFAEMIAGRRFVLIVDEAQNLEDSVLETVRLLSNFETSYSKMLQIVLAGQPQLSDKLAQPQLAQLRQRLAVRARIDPLSPDETANYVEHRLNVAGYSGAPLFNPEAMALIAKRSRGVPRAINHLCYGALAAAYSKGLETVTPEIVAETASKLGFEIAPEERVATIAASVLPSPSPAIATSVVAHVVASPDQPETDQPKIDQFEARETVPVVLAQATTNDAVSRTPLRTSATVAALQPALTQPAQRRGFTLTYEPEKRFRFPRWASRALLVAGILLLGGFSLTAFMLRLGVSDEEKAPKVSPTPMQPLAPIPQPAPSVGTTPSVVPTDIGSSPAPATLPPEPAPSVGTTPTLVTPDSASTPAQAAARSVPAQATLPVPSSPTQTRSPGAYTANPQDSGAGQVITVAAMPQQTVEDLSRIYVGRYDPELLKKIHELNPELTNPIQLQPGQLIRLPMPAGSFRKGKSFTPDE
jgi:hypothetical protein